MKMNPGRIASLTSKRYSQPKRALEKPSRCVAVWYRVELQSDGEVLRRTRLQLGATQQTHTHTRTLLCAFEPAPETSSSMIYSRARTRSCRTHNAFTGLAGVSTAVGFQFAKCQQSRYSHNGNPEQCHREVGSPQRIHSNSIGGPLVQRRSVFGFNGLHKQKNRTQCC